MRGKELRSLAVTRKVIVCNFVCNIKLFEEFLLLGCCQLVMVAFY